VAGFIHRRMEDAHDTKFAPALVKQDRMPTDHPAPNFPRADGTRRANFRPLPQQLERGVDHLGVGESLFDTPFARAISPYVRQIAMGAARNGQSERNCDLVSFR